MPLPIVIGSLIGAGILKQGAFEIAKFAATRALIIGCCMVLIPLAVFKGMALLMEFMINYANTTVEGQSIQPVVVSLTGIAGYLGSVCRIPEAMAIYLSFISLSFMLRLVRIK
jgi:hypothetical protein